MARKGNATVVISGDASQLRKEMAKTNQKLATMTKSMNTKMDSFNKKMKENSVSISSSFKGMFAGAAVVGVFKSAVQSMADLEKQVSVVKAVSGATAEQTKRLKDQFIKLGSTTKFTATEAAQLGEELARLGFTTDQIIDSSEAILQLASAAGTDLPTAAKVAATTLNQFNLKASDAQRVADVMAKSFSSSALDMDKFSNAMAYVGPVAESVGISVEEASAMLAVLADNGIAGSQAGTALRRVLLEMASSGLRGAEGFKEMASRGMNLVDAEDEVGKNAVTAFNKLANLQGKVDELSVSFSNAAGTAGEMASVMEDNLLGDLTKLSSAWDGFIQSGSGLTVVLRELTQGLTELIKLAGGDFSSYQESELVKLERESYRLHRALGDVEIQMKESTNPKDIKGLTKEWRETKKALDDVFSKMEAIRNLEKETNTKSDEPIKLKTADTNDNPVKKVVEAVERVDPEKLAALQLFLNTDVPALERMTELSEVTTNMGESFSIMEDGLIRVNAQMADMKAQMSEIAKANRDEFVGGLERSMWATEMLGDAVIKTVSGSVKWYDALGMSALNAAQEIVRAKYAEAVAGFIADGAGKGGMIGLGVALAGLSILKASWSSNVPALAEGGIVTSPTLALVGEGKESEAVIPLSKLDNMMNPSGGVNVVFNYPVGGEKEVADGIMRALKSRGYR